MADFVGAVDAALVDVDGTLVDSNYHHTLAWYRAFREAGRTIEAWRLDIGRVVSDPSRVAGESFDAAHGMKCGPAGGGMRTLRLVDMEPFRGARDLLEGLSRRGLRVVLASSGPAEHGEVRRPLGARVADAWTTSG